MARPCLIVCTAAAGVAVGMGLRRALLEALAAGIECLSRWGPGADRSFSIKTGEDPGASACGRPEQELELSRLPAVVTSPKRLLRSRSLGGVLAAVLIRGRGLRRTDHGPLCHRDSAGHAVGATAALLLHDHCAAGAIRNRGSARPAAVLETLRSRVLIDAKLSLPSLRPRDAP